MKNVSYPDNWLTKLILIFPLVKLRLPLGWTPRGSTQKEYTCVPGAGYPGKNYIACLP